MPDEEGGAPKETAISQTDGGEAKPRNNSATTKESERPGAPAARRFQRLVPWILVLMAAAILFAIVGGWNRWVGGGGTQKTDDAYLRSDITPLSTKVSGTVQYVAVGDYQRVKAGELLVQLKDDDFRAQVVQAEAEVTAAIAAL